MSIFFRENFGHFSMFEGLPLDENYESRFYPGNYAQYSDFLFSNSEESNNQEFPQFITESLNEQSNPFQREIEPEIFLAPTNQNLTEINEEKKNVERTNEINSGNKETKNTSLNKIDDNITSKIKTVNNKKLLGRKRKGYTGEKFHTKYMLDNLMRKIKSRYFKYIIKKLNSSLSPGHKEFCNIFPEVSKNLNVDYNLELMKKSLKTIFEENPINERYSTKRKDYNAILIKEIYEKNEEVETIKILNTSFIKYLDFIRKNNLKEFRDEIFNKEVKNGEENAEELLDGLVELLFDYEGWFSRKTPKKKAKSKKP